MPKITLVSLGNARSEAINFERRLTEDALMLNYNKYIILFQDETAL